MGFIDTCNRAATFVNPGHPLPVLWSSGAPPSLDIPVSPPLGGRDESIYREYSTSFKLLYTDGLIERRDEHIVESAQKLMRRRVLIEPDPLESALDLPFAEATTSFCSPCDGPEDRPRPEPGLRR